MGRGAGGGRSGSSAVQGGVAVRLLCDEFVVGEMVQVADATTRPLAELMSS